MSATVSFARREEAALAHAIWRLLHDEPPRSPLLHNARKAAGWNTPKFRFRSFLAVLMEACRTHQRDTSHRLEAARARGAL